MTFQWIAFLLLATGLIFVGLGLSALVRRHQKTSDWQTASGVVVRLPLKTLTPGNPYYFPVVEFQLPGGETIHFETDVGSYPRSYTQGQNIPVIYDPANPHDAAVITAVGLYFKPAVITGLGVICLILGLMIQGIMSDLPGGFAFDRAPGSLAVTWYYPIGAFYA